MSDVIYTFNGKDITMNVCIQIRAVVDIMQEQLGIDYMLFGQNRRSILPKGILKRWKAK
ncbi:hypothetical protein [Blautia marasmi]|uniref:hypothetical protein n=1 Tax=Blautia marasmi TaxID=1917868 RepID=UPI001FA8BAC9|nr:hypothetical protein [Blautia marasmi]